MATSFDWVPTNGLIHGRIVNKFLPLKKHPQLGLQNDNFSNLYPGDEVYVFEETTDQEWCRGYICWQPLPEDFISRSSSYTDKLPEQKFKVVVFPKRFVHLYYDEETSSLPFLQLPEESQFKSASSNPDLSCMYDLTGEWSRNDVLEFRSAIIKKKRPPFPFYRMLNYGVIGEMGPILALLVSHIYSMYSFGEFETAEHLAELYYRLDDIRLRLEFNLTTKQELEKLIKFSSALSYKIAKFISVKGMRNRYAFDGTTIVDSSGYGSVLCRDIETGELYEYEKITPQLLSCSSMLCALSKNFPSANFVELQMEPPANMKYDSLDRSNILVDFKDVESGPGINPNFQNLSAFMYLRTAKKVLTEPFILNMNRDDIVSVDSISAAFFNNIPPAEIDNTKIYLAVILQENIQIEIQSPDPSKGFQAPFIPFQSSRPNVITHINKGLAGGVVDITRVFTRRKGSLAGGTSHHFNIELFASYFSKRKESAKSIDGLKNGRTAYSTSKSEGNNGWGELIDRIIADSNQGIAVNPRAISLSVTVREVKRNSNSSSLLSTNMNAIQSIPTFFYDTLSPPEDRIYLTLGKVSIFNLKSSDTNVSSVSIHLSTSNEDITFRKGSNDESKSNWLFVSVKAGESVGEIIRIDGLSKMQDNETLRVSAYLNGYLMAKSKFYIKRNGTIIEYPQHSVFQLMSTSSEPLVEIEVMTEYVGKTYNVKTNVTDILALRLEADNFGQFEEKAVHLLGGLKTIPLTDLVKHFDPLLMKILELFYIAHISEGEKSSEELKVTAFTALVHFLDVVVAREDNFRHLFNDFMKKSRAENIARLSKLGPHVINYASVYFRESHTKWDYNGRSLCRVSVYLLKISLITWDHEHLNLLKSYDNFFEAVCHFFSFTKESTLVDQVTILDAFDIWISALSKHCEPKKLIEFATRLFQACHEKERITGIQKRPMTVREQRFVNAKLLLMRRLIIGPSLKKYLFESKSNDEERMKFIPNVIEWSFEPFFSYNNDNLDLSTIRLANGVLISIITYASEVMQRNLVRLLPTLCRFFILVRKFCKEKDLFKFRRTFTALFPVSHPFPEITVDSIINEEIVVEALIELATIIASVTKIAENILRDSLSFMAIIKQCSNDRYFDSVFYINQFAREDLLSIIHTVKLFLKGKFFPAKRWLSLNELFMRSSLCLLSLCKDILIEYKIPSFDVDEESFDVKLWCDFFKTTLVIGNHIPSNPTSLAEIPRKAVYNIGGDYRQTTASLLEECWDALGQKTDGSEVWLRFGVQKAGGYQRFIATGDKTIIREILEFTFQRHAEARRVGAKIVWGTIVNCWVAFKTLTPVMDLALPELCFAFQSGKFQPTDYELENYMRALLYTIHIKREDEAFGPVVMTLKMARNLLNVLSDANAIPEDAEFDDDRTAHQITIFGYLMRAKRPEEFHKLINDLYVYNMKKKDYVQAALSLELLARTYEWDPNDSLPAVVFPPLPVQSSFARREYLFKEAARNFYRGLKLEKALTVYKELAQAYEQINYDLNALAQVHGNISRLYNDLQTVNRLIPTYFKVTFVGFGFPTSIRQKSFIYEGLPFEHITSMQSRILLSHPGSRLITKQEEMDNLLVNPPMGKCIHVIAVEPQLGLSEKFINQDKKNSVNNKIRLYIENRNLNTFCGSRMLPGASSVTDLWVKEFTYETTSTFPTLMNRAEIKKVSEKTLSPIENAIKSMQFKIQDLTGLEDTCCKLIKENGDYSGAFSELSRNISGTIDAPVNGGVSQYREFFLTVDGAVVAEENQLSLLKSTFDELAVTLNKCLVLYGEMCQSHLKKTHIMLLNLYRKNFADEIERNHITVGESDEDLISRIRSNQTQATQPSLELQQDLLTPQMALMSSAASVYSSGSGHSRGSSELATTASQHSAGVNSISRNSVQSSKISLFRKPPSKMAPKADKPKTTTNSFRKPTH
ncbi:LAFE_0A02850g1_1 [Lachancea fermentati]|uniref:LAFE_0A02850g1_1 n=1 Tax=Lachancea fermentati TaxID=4955 RepID=A0A1G4M6M1_LACFM|nr:LAFE_0A02850g1_1 [Lachancea fermentati]